MSSLIANLKEIDESEEEHERHLTALLEHCYNQYQHDQKARLMTKGTKDAVPMCNANDWTSPGVLIEYFRW